MPAIASVVDAVGDERVATRRDVDDPVVDAEGGRDENRRSGGEGERGRGDAPKKLLDAGLLKADSCGLARGRRGDMPSPHLIGRFAGRLSAGRGRAQGPRQLSPRAGTAPRALAGHRPMTTRERPGS